MFPAFSASSSKTGPEPPSKTRKHLAIVLGVVVLTVIPFATKAMHIDDVYFLEVADTILNDPLRPFAGAVALEDNDYNIFARAGRCPNTFESMSHPPLVPYLMAFVAWLAGGFRELPLHLAFSLFAITASVAMYDLARRFTSAALVTTLLLVSSPVFAISAQGLMTDMPALALSLVALALFIRGVDGQRRALVLLSGTLAGLAILTRYSALLVLPLLLVYAFLHRRVREAWPALLGGGAVALLWALQNLALHGELHVAASARHYRLFFADGGLGWVGLLNKTLGDLSGLGGTSFAAAVALLATSSRRRVLSFVIAFSLAAVVFLVQPHGVERLNLYSSPEIIAVAASFACGALLLVEALSRSNRETVAGDAGRDARFLVVWLVMSVAGALLLLPFGTVRYMLPVLPPLCILLVSRFWDRDTVPAWTRLATGVVVVQGLVLGLALAVADEDLAGSYRDVAERVRATHPDRTLWFVGEWGFRHYMSRVGGRYLTSTSDSPAPGDIVVRPFVAGMHAMSPSLLARTSLLEQRPLESRWPIRVMNFEAKAGYYSHHWGYLPWAFSRAPLDVVDIFEVRSPAPLARSVPCASS